ncbi:MAG: hypothetical protein ACE37J_15255 [Pikeienuella sp.]|uniref:hypothetical protein n=1 Tax=Pikeienuella sp. TaxID=2831957 RepID=UPI00391CB54F
MQSVSPEPSSAAPVGRLPGDDACFASGVHEQHSLHGGAFEKLGMRHGSSTWATDVIEVPPDLLTLHGAPDRVRYGDSLTFVAWWGG